MGLAGSSPPSVKGPHLGAREFIAGCESVSACVSWGGEWQWAGWSFFPFLLNNSVIFLEVNVFPC